MANSLWCVNHVHSAFMNSETVDSISSDIKYHVYEERHFRSEYIHEKQKDTLQEKFQINIHQVIFYIKYIMITAGQFLW